MKEICIFMKELKKKKVTARRPRLLDKSVVNERLSCVEIGFVKRPQPWATPPVPEQTNQKAVREKRAAQVSLQVCMLFFFLSFHIVHSITTPACTGCLDKHRWTTIYMPGFLNLSNFMLHMWIDVMFCKFRGIHITLPVIALVINY